MGKGLNKALNAIATAGSNSLASIIEEKKARRLAKYEQGIRQEDALFQQKLSQENATFQHGLKMNEIEAEAGVRREDQETQHGYRVSENQQLIDARIEAAQTLATQTSLDENEKRILGLYKDVNDRMSKLNQDYMEQIGTAIDEKSRAALDAEYAAQIESLASESFRLLSANRDVAKKLGYDDSFFKDETETPSPAESSSDQTKSKKPSKSDPEPAYFTDERADEFSVSRKPGLLTKAKKAASAAKEHVGRSLDRSRVNGLKAFAQQLERTGWSLTDTDAAELSAFTPEELREAGIPQNIIEYVSVAR